MSIVCFHNPDEENACLSNWFPSRFEAGGVAYSSLEQFMMHRKALCFGDQTVAAQIMGTDDPAVIKGLGRLVANYDDNHWNGVRQIVVYEGLLAKFSQNAELADFLASTGNNILAECSVSDRIWGIGLSMTDPARFDRTKWNGQNLMGYTLMAVREKLR